MKIRTDFVSNSSSSSFIVDLTVITEAISFIDLVKAVKSLFDTKLIDHEMRIYDISTPEGYQEAVTKERNFLNQWTDKMCGKHRIYKQVVEILKDYGKVDFDLSVPPWQQSNNQLETPVIQTLNIMRKNMNVRNMGEILLSKQGKILICFDEGVLWKAKHISDTQWYDTQPTTADRFCELLTVALWELGYDDIDYHKLRSCFHGNDHQG